MYSYILVYDTGGRRRLAWHGSKTKENGMLEGECDGVKGRRMGCWRGSVMEKKEGEWPFEMTARANKTKENGVQVGQIESRE